MSPFNWSCPHCERLATITNNAVSDDTHTLSIPNAIGRRGLVTTFIVCPNPDCNKFALTASLFDSKYNYRSTCEEIGKQLQSWDLIPDSRAKNFPDYIPQALREDYREACLIKDLSPKASATLARRCLQGMIRDFWGVRAKNLAGEIAAIEEKVDANTLRAITAVRKIGNIGAHMEKDIDLIVDVEPEEADLLIQLIETLLREWYVERYEREERMAKVVAAADAKMQARTASSKDLG